MQNTHQSDETDVSVKPRTTLHNKRKVYFVGSGSAALAGAAFLIPDGLIPGESIHLFEELKVAGGSLDGTGSPDKGRNGPRNFAEINPRIAPAHILNYAGGCRTEHDFDYFL